MVFSGWSDEALEMLELAEASWSQARLDAHETLVRAPMAALCEDLAEEFGAAYVWHLHRDPFLWRNQVAEVEVADRVDLGVRLSLDGLGVWGGARRLAPQQLAAYRSAVLDEVTGAQLARAVGGLVPAGRHANSWRLDGDVMKTRPHGVDPRHPRLDLLRHRELVLRRDWAVGAWLSTAEPVDRVRTAWRELAPVTAWLARHLGPDPRRRG